MLNGNGLIKTGTLTSRSWSRSDRGVTSRSSIIQMLPRAQPYPSATANQPTRRLSVTYAVATLLSTYLQWISQRKTIHISCDGKTYKMAQTKSGTHVYMTEHMYVALFSAPPWTTLDYKYCFHSKPQLVTSQQFVYRYVLAEIQTLPSRRPLWIYPRL